MDCFYHIQKISHYHSKLVQRSWLFRFFCILTLGGITFYQLCDQSTLLFPLFRRTVELLPSFIPNMNAYLYTILQVLPVIFLAGMFVQAYKTDSRDVIYARPESNTAYVIGMVWGTIKPIFGVGVLSLLLGTLIHLFGTPVPWNGWLYLFYLLTLVFPALVYISGLSFLLHALFRSRGLTMLMLLGYVMITQLYISNVGYGAFDFMGLSLPNTFSEISGHPEMGRYLLQRGGWPLLGIGCIGFTMRYFHRLPNRQGSRRRQCLMASLFIAGGLSCGLCAYSMVYVHEANRALYGQVYEKYNARKKLSLISQEIHFKQQGHEIISSSRMVLQNEHTQTLEEWMLYLNPSLKITTLTSGDISLPFTRDAQVVVVHKKLFPGEQVEVCMEYNGGMDEAVCYLDVPDEKIRATYKGDTYLACRYGRHYLFLDSRYTLLTPECLWYPVSTPPVTPSSPYLMEKNFTHYTLHIERGNHKEWLSQGERMETGERISFRAAYPLTGLTLVGGEYTRFSLPLASRTYELYLSREHEEFIKGVSILHDTLPGLIREQMEKTEAEMGVDYPFDRLMLAEVPATFFRHYRHQRGGGEGVQPEMILLPERGVNRDGRVDKLIQSLIKRDTKQEKTALEHAILAFNSFYPSLRNEHVFNSNYIPNHFLRLLTGNTGYGTYVNNPNTMAPLFFNYSTSIYSEQIPVMDIVVNTLLNKTGGKRYMMEENAYAIQYLNSHSFEDAIRDKNLPPMYLHHILKLKSGAIQERLAAEGLSRELFFGICYDFFFKNRFKKVTAEALSDSLESVTGKRLAALLPQWYTGRDVPAFRFKDLELARVEGEGYTGDYQNTPYRIQLKVFNDGEVDGVISISMEKIPLLNFASSDLSTSSLYFLIPSKTAKHIAFTVPQLPPSVILNTHIAKNFPNTISFNKFAITTDTTQFTLNMDSTYFAFSPDEIIVDNEDACFKIINTHSSSRLSDWLHSKKVAEKWYIDYKVADRYKIFSQWALFIDDGTYVTYVMSFVGKTAGNGEARTEWHAHLEKAGYYEVFAYTFSSQSKEILRIPVSRIDPSNPSNAPFTPLTEDIVQYYTVHHDKGKEEIGLSIRDAIDGWNSLGRFYFSPGEHIVSLSDRGIPSQRIFADAVKWVWIEEASPAGI